MNPDTNAGPGPSILENFELPDLNFLGDLGSVAQNFAENIIANVSPAELAIIISLIFFLLLVLRFKVVLHLFLWILAGVIVFIIAGILFNVVNL